MTNALDVEKLRFSQRQRLTYLESVAYWEGAVDRPRISSVFDVSENHVTKDFRLYKDAFPDNLRYDETTRAYRPTRRFKPRIATGTAEEYLSILRGYVERAGSAGTPGLGMVAQVYAMPQPVGSVDKDILNSITRAISSHTGLEISYQSMSKAQPGTRTVWPHALIFTGTRWHARAYDSHYGEFIDLVLQRILSAKPINDHSPVTAFEDGPWNRVVDIEVVPKLKLTPTQSAVVAREFGMTKSGTKWSWTVQMRECLAGYFIIFHRLDVENDARRLIMLRDPSLVTRYLTSHVVE